MKEINVVQNIDSRNILSILPDKACIQATITSPPYYDMKDYGVDNQIGFGQTYENYLVDLQSVFSQILEKTKDDGTLWIVIDTFKRNGSIVPLPFDLANKLKEIGWHFQDIIIWKKDKTVPWSTSGFTQKKIEYILFFSKTEKYKYNKDIIRVYDTQQLKTWWVKYPERYNPKGKALDQVWEFSIPVQGSWGQKYVRHFCPLPKEMVATMISLSTDENDIILDPFAGSGAVLAQASYMNRKYIGAELNKEYILQFNKYLKETHEEGLAEYNQLQINRDQYLFEDTIWSLRALKFGRLLLKEIENRGNPGIRLLVSRENVVNDKLQVRYTILITEQTTIINENIIHDIINRKPFTKFGIIPIFEYKLIDSIQTKSYYCYSITNTHSYIKDTSKKEIKIYSDIKVDINEKDY